MVSRRGKKGDHLVWISASTDYRAVEMDELHWFIRTRKGTKTGVNSYLMTFVSRVPRQIVAFEVDKSVNSEAIQRMADSLEPFHKYYVDGCKVYQDVDFLGLLKQNFEDKSDTHNIESTNSDLRQFIAGLRRKSRCFFRSFETLKAVLYVFLNAYNRFGEWKMKYFAKNPLADRDLGFNHTRFI